MPITLDRHLLAELGLGDLSPEDAQLVLTTMHGSLQRRVERVLSRRITNADVERFRVAKALGTAASARVLSEIAPDYAAIVEAEFEALRDEVALDAPTIRQAYVRADADHEPWRHRRPDPGPTAVLAWDDWTLVISPLASVCLALDPGGTELYARRRSYPPVVLQVPDGHRVDRTMLWCDDRGEVRARFATHSDLRWRLADAPTSPVVAYDKVLHHRRRPLSLVDSRVRGSGLVTFTEGRWRIEDDFEIKVTDRVNDRSFRLQPFHPDGYWNALEPHFTPDRSQLVAAYNRYEPPEECGLKACSVGYLHAAGVLAATDPASMPWEHDVDPAATTERPATAGGRVPRIEAVGYDASSTRAAVSDQFEAHLFHVREWTRLGDIARPDQQARVAAVPVPRGATPLVAWAGRAVVVGAADGRLWRLDLDRGPVTLQPLEGNQARPPLVLVSWADQAAAVYDDRTVVGIDGDGTTGVTRLPGDEPLEGAAALIDGRLLVFTATGLELFAGTRLVGASPTTVPVAGLATCTRDASWAIAWHGDQSVSSVRLGTRRVHVDQEPLPHLPDDAPPVRAIDGEMSDVDRWHLLVPTGAGDRRSSEILSPLGTVPLAATSATSMPSAGMVLFATPEGFEFLPASRPRAPYPHPVALPGPVEAVATGRCARSVAAIAGGDLWLVRLLR